jgi:hypothetical protein
VTDNSYSKPPRARGTPNLLRFALRLGGTAVRPAVAVVVLGRHVEHDVRGRVGRRLGDGVLAAVDSVLASELAAGTIDRVVASPLAERALSRALEGPLVDALARDVVRHAVVERLADPLLRAEVLEAVLERAEQAQVPQRLIESRLVDEAVMRLLQSDDLWLLVEEVARSPAVTEAITQQSIGFADQVADGVRARSRSADLWLESAARRALRRKPVDDRPSDGEPVG